MTVNTQNLPAGLAGRAAAATAPAPAPAPAPAVPAAPAPAAPAPAPSQPFDSLQPKPEGEFVNPMLSHVSQPAAQPAAPAAAEAPVVPAVAPLAPVPVPAPEKPAAAAPTASVAALAGTFAADVNLAPAVGYLDNICTEKGIDTARAFGKAAEHGDARFIDTAYLTEVLGETAAASIAKVGGDIVAYINAYTEQSVAAVVEAAGGQAAWEHATTLFNKNADKMTRQIVADLLDSNDREKMAHAGKLVAQYAVSQGGAISHNAPALGIPGGQKGITQAEHVANISKRGVTQAQYQESLKLRQLGKSQGL